MINPSGPDSIEALVGSTAAMDEEMVALSSFKMKIFVFDISANPTLQVAVLGSTDSTTYHLGDGFGMYGLAVNRKYGILVGAPILQIGSNVRIRVFILVTQLKGDVLSRD